MRENRKCRRRTALLAAIMCAFIAVANSGCSGSQQSSSEGSTPHETSSASAKGSTSDEAKRAVDGLEKCGIDADALGIYPNIKYDTINDLGFQLDMPKQDDTIAIIHTSMGDIKLRLFAELAPTTVTNFINLAKAGKYNGTLFYGIVKDSLVECGQYANDDGSLGSSYYGSAFDDEFCDKLLNIRGAVAMSNAGRDSNNCGFLINQKTAEQFKKEGGWEKYQSQWKETCEKAREYSASNFLSTYIEQNGRDFYNADIISEDVKNLYLKNGGNPSLDGAYNAVDRGNTVFAQVYEGLETVDKISALETDAEGLPKTTVTIKSIEITAYKA